MSIPGCVPVPRTEPSLSLKPVRREARSASVLRRPSSTRARRVRPSWAATRLASSRSASAISMVVFIWVTISPSRGRGGCGYHGAGRGGGWGSAVFDEGFGGAGGVVEGGFGGLLLGEGGFDGFAEETEDVG